MMDLQDNMEDQGKQQQKKQNTNIQRTVKGLYSNNKCFPLLYNTIECGVTTTRTTTRTTRSDCGQANRGGRGGSAPKVGKGVVPGRK